MTSNNELQRGGGEAVLVLDRRAYSEMEDAIKDRLHARFAIRTYWSLDEPNTFLALHGGEFRALIGHGGGNTELMDKLPNLEIVAQMGIGLDKTPIAYARSRGIRIVSGAGSLTDDVAELAVGLMLAAARGIVSGNQYTRSGDWLKGPHRMGRRVSGKTCAILGVGQIGRSIAARAAGFGMRILYHNRKPVDGVPYEYVANVEAMAAEADYLLIAAPGGAATRHLVNERVLRALGPQGFVVNVGRGSIIDEDALVRVVQAGELGGAGLDVYPNEPHINPELLKLPNVVLLPHLGASTMEARRDMHQLCLDNLVAHFEGRPLLTPVSGT